MKQRMVWGVFPDAEPGAALHIAVGVEAVPQAFAIHLRHAERVLVWTGRAIHPQASGAADWQILDKIFDPVSHANGNTPYRKRRQDKKSLDRFAATDYSLVTLYPYRFTCYE